MAGGRCDCCTSDCSLASAGSMRDEGGPAEAALGALAQAGDEQRHAASHRRNPDQRWQRQRSFSIPLSHAQARCR